MAKQRQRIYPLYKATPPYMVVPKDQGVGYLGVLMYDALRDRVQCHICGEWVQQLTLHTLRAHKVADAQYRERFGFTKHIPLCSKGISAMHKKHIETHPHIYTALRQAATSPEIQRRGAKARKSKRYARAISAAFMRASYKNAHNICEEQLRGRLRIVAQQCAKLSPSYADIRKYDPALYGILRRHYGTYLKGKLALGFTRNHGSKPLPDELLIANLRKWVIEHGTMPPANKYPQYITCVRHFGSWAKAKAAAGLNLMARDRQAFRLDRACNNFNTGDKD